MCIFNSWPLGGVASHPAWSPPTLQRFDATGAASHAVFTDKGEHVLMDTESYTHPLSLSPALSSTPPPLLYPCVPFPTVVQAVHKHPTDRHQQEARRGGWHSQARIPPGRGISRLSDALQAIKVHPVLSYLAYLSSWQAPLFYSQP